MADGIIGHHYVAGKLHDDLPDYVLLANSRTNIDGHLVGNKRDGRLFYSDLQCHYRKIIGGNKTIEY